MLLLNHQHRPPSLVESLTETINVLTLTFDEIESLLSEDTLEEYVLIQSDCLQQVFQQKK